MSRLIGLQCPQCQENVEGENHSLVFFCRQCRLAFDVSDGKSARFPLGFAKAQIVKKDSPVYFPFWRVESQFHLIDGSAQEKKLEKDEFLVPAFFIKHIDTFSDVGYLFYKNRVTLERDVNQGWLIHPATRPAYSAANFPSLYLHKFESEKRGGAKFDIQVGGQRFMLALIPFFQINDQYVDSLLGISFPSGALL